MQLYRQSKWGSLTSDTSSSVPGSFVGVAIGPESEAGIVRVNHVLLQAGHVLPLASSTPYQLTRHVLPPSKVTEVGILELVLFECIEEMAAYRGRAMGRFSASKTTTSDTLISVLKVPFEARRQAKVTIYSSGDLAELAVSLYGRQYNAARGSVDSVELVSYDAGDFSGTAAAVSFYTGGTDNGEAWEGLDVQLSEADGTSTTFYVDVTTIGDIG